VRPGERGNEEDGGLTCACKKKIKGWKGIGPYESFKARLIMSGLAQFKE
jgi:hypothetical protein